MHHCHIGRQTAPLDPDLRCVSEGRWSAGEHAARDKAFLSHLVFLQITLTSLSINRIPGAFGTLSVLAIFIHIIIFLKTEALA